MTIRIILPLIITAAIIALCVDLSREAHRIEAAFTGVASKADASVAKVDADIVHVSSSVDAAVSQLHTDAVGLARKLNAAADRAGTSAEKAVTNAINPLPSMFKPPATPAKKP